VPPMSSPEAKPTDNLPAAEKPRRFYVPQLDGLRFMAFLLVFVHHGPRLSTLFAADTFLNKGFRVLEGFGWFGVDLFLVLSAFLITSLLLIEHDRHGNISLRGFYMRRILRIWPLYYLMCGIGFFLLPWLAYAAAPLSSPEHAYLMKVYFIPYVTLFGNFASGVHAYPPVATLAHLWTVTLEEQFYIGWPLILSLTLRTRKFVLWILLSVLLAGTLILRFRLTGTTKHPYIWTHTLARLDPLVIGIAVAVWRHRHAARPGWLLPLVKVMGGWILVCVISYFPPIEAQTKHVVWVFLATATGFGLILDGILSREGNPIAWLLSRRPLVWLGKLTYGLYVYHILGLTFGSEFALFLQGRQILVTPGSVTVGRWLISLIFTIVIAAESYRVFESFFLKLKDRFARVKSRPVEEGSAPKAA
jgi:peptidoglycan/LPS O-acetylase OafA/YrhL